MRRAGTALVATTVTLGLVAPTASAVTKTYATSTTPQTVTGYSSTGESYGTWVGYDRTKTTIYTGLDARYKFVDADNHSIYTQFHLSAKGRTSGASWSGGDASSHESTVSSSWRSFSSKAQRMEPMNTAGTIDATVTVQTCLDIPWRRDTCSKTRTSRQLSDQGKDEHMLNEVNRVRRAVIVAGVALASILGGSVAANAIDTPGTWNSQSRPLEVTHYSSTASAAGSAYISNGSNGTRIYNRGTHKFTDADNHRPYLQATSEWNAGTCRDMSSTVQYRGVQVGGSSTCARVFYDGANFARAEGVAYTTSTWKAFPTKSARPNSGSDRGRAKVQLCIDVPWRTDKCTGHSYSTADSF